MEKKTLFPKGSISSRIICAPQNYFGEALKEIRLEKGYTQEEASALLGVKQPQWSAYEKGVHRPNLDVIIAIAIALKINPFDLINRSLDKSKYFSSKGNLRLTRKNKSEKAQKPDN